MRPIRACATDSNTAFGEDVQRGYKQTAVFASVDIDMIPKVLTADRRHPLLPLRRVRGRLGVLQRDLEHPLNVAKASQRRLHCGAAACGFGMNLHKSESGTRAACNLTWHITPDIMAYYTWSQGFRPGGFNRTSTIPGRQRPR